jgi:hypothetical protein
LFENKRNDFAQNYFAESLETEFHATEKRIVSKGVGSKHLEASGKKPRTLLFKLEKYQFFTRFASLLCPSLFGYFILTGIGVITTSIRRLMARPSSVLLDARGRPDPYPTASIFSTGKVLFATR